MGIAIFERDGLLIRPNIPPGDLALSDINDRFVEMLQQLREQNVLYGFISRRLEIGDGFESWSEYDGLTRILDGLLGVRDALPDFWIGWVGTAGGNDAEFQDRNDWSKDDINVISRAIDWYGVDKKRAVFVGNSWAGALAVQDAGIMGLQFSGWQCERGLPGTKGADPVRRAIRPDAIELGRLRAGIERGLGLDHQSTLSRR
ncbi:hypothetical protein [Neorhizobium galegae]|uniref:hypothetical protein n=1 Tax=Neorhizobium galegae TaxID=399 RepID=UPI002108176F|nr:hypothetical protein [Neorhizobium galegae]MCQ1854992.1 hypothetical protein [Neorhizobium galegae]